MLFTDRSLWTLLHGVGLGGAALFGLATALYALLVSRSSTGAAAESQSRALTRLIAITAFVLWVTVLLGTYVVFPPYRATPPAGAGDLSLYPRAMLLASPGTAWLHSFAMESKEHMPWIAAMLATAVAFVAARYRTALLHEDQLRTTALLMLTVSFVLAAFVGLMGIFVDKVAPLH